MDTKALFKIGYGLYVLTTHSKGVDNGCIINTVQQVTDNPLRISIVVNKQNYTHRLIMESGVFNISVLTTKTPFSVYERFGFHSGNDTEKFADKVGFERAANDVLYMSQNANAFLSCQTAQIVDLGTHTMFVADLVDAQVISDDDSVTYDYYQHHVKPSAAPKKGCWVCALCGWVYEGNDLPDDIICPICKHGKSEFEYVAEATESENSISQISTNQVEKNQSSNPMKNLQFELAENIYYVGVNDRRTELFENHIEIPNGVSYNSYLIVDDKVVLIDPVESGFMSQYLSQIKAVLGERQVDYLVINHDEPDHSGAVAAVVSAYPDVTVIGNDKTFGPLENFYGPIANKKVVVDGEVLPIGKHTLQFFTAPMCHWPESMVTFEQTTGIIFSNDAFGGFGTLNGTIFDDEVNLDFYEDDMRRYYANIVGKVAPMALKAIQKVGPLPIKMIAPSHGLIWRTNLEWVLSRYTQWSKHETQKGVVIAYASMYGNTGRMADIIARGVSAAGVKEIKIFDISKTDVSIIMSEIWKYKGVILGASSHYGSIFPNMTLLLHEIAEFKPKNRFYALFGGASWSGGGLKTLKAQAECCQWNVVTEPTEVLGAPIKEEDIEKLYKLGLDLGQKVME